MLRAWCEGSRADGFKVRVSGLIVRGGLLVESLAWFRRFPLWILAITV